MNIRTLIDLSFEQIFGAFAEAFKDYEMQLDEAGLRKMLKRRGFVPELSFGAFENDRLVSFTFNGIGDYLGIKTAYDTGTGTVEEYRGQGLATEIFNFSIPILRKAGVKQYLLEVLQHNDAAISVYKKLGFKVVREFNYFVEDISNINLPKIDKSTHPNIKQIDLSYKDDLEACWDFHPSWQNCFDAIHRTVEDFILFGVYDGQNLAGYIIIEPGSGDITQLAIKEKYRKQGIGSILFSKALELNQISSIKVINAEIGCKTITEFLKSLNIAITGKQYEMARLIE